MAPAAGESARFVTIGCGGDAATVDACQVGAKAAGLAKLAAGGLRVPPLFVLPSGLTAQVAAAGGRLPGGLDDAVDAALRKLEAAEGARLGDPSAPLLVSVRSGASVSMPGMMETLLNVGLSEATVPGLIRRTGNPRLAWDAYRRLVAGYGEVVTGIAAQEFEAETARIAGTADPRLLDFEQLRTLARAHAQLVARRSGHEFPQDARVQLRKAIAAVFASWHSPKASNYRRTHGIPDDLGTAVAVQAMVFGNAGGLSGAGVGFTRDPVTGDRAPWVDFLFDAQGEDVVSGRSRADGHAQLASAAPALWEELQAAAARLERLFQDMQDFEFTMQEGRLYFLQSRTGKRGARAAARIALDMVDEGLIPRELALRRLETIDPQALEVQCVVAEDGARAQPAASALSASAGVASGEIALDEARARRRNGEGAAVILVRRDAETDDIAALQQAAGILTARGARTSHAAVVARDLGKVCLVGCETLAIDLAARRIRLGSRELSEGDLISIDGNEGRVYAGRVRTQAQRPRELLQRLENLRSRCESASNQGLTGIPITGTPPVSG
jgi:pyruvate,orthophosphate dikinase